MVQTFSEEVTNPVLLSIYQARTEMIQALV